MRAPPGVDRCAGLSQHRGAASLTDVDVSLPQPRQGGPGPAGGSDLLLRDARTAFLLVNAARHRALERMFGISPDQANAVTVIGLILLAQSAHENLGRFLIKPRPPGLVDGFVLDASVRNVFRGVAGPTVADAPGLSTLLALAVLGAAARPIANESLRALRSSSQRLTLGFHHRYGYLVDPGHWRSRRAERRTA